MKEEYEERRKGDMTKVTDKDYTEQREKVKRRQSKRRNRKDETGDRRVRKKIKKKGEKKMTGHSYKGERGKVKRI